MPFFQLLPNYCIIMAVKVMTYKNWLFDHDDHQYLEHLELLSSSNQKQVYEFQGKIPPFEKNDPELILIELSGVAHNFSVFESSHLSFESKSVIVILINSLATFAVLDIKCPKFSLFVENVFISHSRGGENTCYKTFGETTMKTKSHG